QSRDLVLFTLRLGFSRPDSDSFLCAVRVGLMAPPSLWSGNLRLSLVLIPVRLVPAVSTDEAISFRQIHKPSGTPIRQIKGIRDGDTFIEVPDATSMPKGITSSSTRRRLMTSNLRRNTPSTWCGS